MMVGWMYLLTESQQRHLTHVKHASQSICHSLQCCTVTLVAIADSHLALCLRSKGKTALYHLRHIPHNMTFRLQWCLDAALLKQ